MLLVTCSECEKPNTLDSQFCRSCGHALPQNQLSEARQANESLIEGGFKLLSEGRHDEAYLVAVESLNADPSQIQALSLKGDALERLGKLADALACYERVAELSPNSPLDRIKVEHVRRMLAAIPEPVQPNRRAAIGAAVAATALVGCIGLTTALTLGRANAATPDKATITDGNKPLQPKTQPQGNQSLPQAKEVSRADYERLRQQALADHNQSPSVNDPRPNTGSDRLPAARNNGGSEDLNGSVGPLRPNMAVPIMPNGPSSQGGSTLPNPQVDPDPPVTQPETTTSPRPTNGNPQVDIRPTPGGNTTQVGGSETIDENTPTWRDHANRARQFFNSGDYGKAAQAYEAALAAGASPASTNQRLGQCYQRLGRKADAKRAYENAVRYYTAMVQASPDNDSLRAALEACQSALKALG